MAQFNLCTSAGLATLAVTLMSSTALADLVDVPYRFTDGYRLIQKQGDQDNQDYGRVAAVVDGIDGTRNIGTLKSQYQLYLGNHAGNDDPATSGTAGFFADFKVSLPANVAKKDGFSFAWVQIVSAMTDAGQNAFGAGAGEWFVDIGGTYRANPAYTTSMRNFNDYPDRRLLNDEVWSAELVLALINPADKEIATVGSLNWGFSIWDSILEGSMPTSFDAVSSTFTSAFRHDWPSVSDYSDWTFVASGLEKVVPGSGVASLMLVGLVAHTRRRR